MPIVRASRDSERVRIRGLLPPCRAEAACAGDRLDESGRERPRDHDDEEHDDRSELRDAARKARDGEEDAEHDRRPAAACRVDGLRRDEQHESVQEGEAAEDRETDGCGVVGENVTITAAIAAIAARAICT